MIISPFFPEKQASSNSLTICPLPNQPRLPPFFFEGHKDLSLASSSKDFPWLRSYLMIFASCSVLTNIWLAFTFFMLTNKNRPLRHQHWERQLLERLSFC